MSDVLRLAPCTTAEAAIRRPAEQVVRKQEVVTQPGEARPPGLVLVGDEVAAGYPRRDGSDVGEGVGLLERHMAADPARRPDVQMAGEVPHGARSDGSRVQVARAGDDRRPLEQAELARCRLRQPAEHAPRRHEIGQLGPVEAGRFDESVVIGDRTDITVVRDPVHGDGVVGGAGQTGQAQVEIVNRLEEHLRRPVHVGPLFTQEVDVTHRILAREAGDPTGTTHPARQLGRRVALDVERTPDGVADRSGAPRVHPDDGVADRFSAGADGHRSRPLRGASDSDDRLGTCSGVRQHPPRGGDDRLPPVLR